MVKMSLTPTFLIPEELIQRFLYTNTYNGLFYTGKPLSFDKEDHDYLFTLADQNPQSFIDIMTAANRTTMTQRRGNIFLLLATVLNSDKVSQEAKNKIKPLVLSLLKNDAEFFDFIQYFTTISKNKITKTLKKIIVKFYRNKRPLELAKCVTAFKGRHNWTHKDLVKLCHLKMEEPCSTIIIKYVLYGIKALEGVDCKEMHEIQDILTKFHTLNTSKDVTEVANLVRETKSDVWIANSTLNKTEEVWEASLPNMTLRDILKRLPKLYKWGLLKSGSGCLTQIVGMLNDPKKVEESQLHPIEVYVYLRKFEKGGKGLDPKLENWLTQNSKEELVTRLKNPPPPKCTVVLQNINKALTLSYQNLKPTNKHIFIGVDIAGPREDVCFHNRNITTLEAVATIIRCLIKVEKEVTVGVLANDSVRPIHLSKTHNVAEMIKKLTEVECKFALQTSAFDWALQKKKNYDLFIIFMSKMWMSRVPPAHKEKMMERPSDAFTKYTKKAKNGTDAKFVRVFLDGPRIAACLNKGTKNMLTMAGFTEETPWILNSFMKGDFC